MTHPEIPPPHRSLAAVRPDLVEIWDEEANGKPAEHQYANAQVVAHWRCRIDPTHRYTTYVNAKTRVALVQCKLCPARPEPGQSLAEQRPDIAALWDTDANLPYTTQDVGPGSNFEAAWKCDVYPNLHRWRSTVNLRTRTSGCPFCAGSRVHWLTNSIAAVASHLVWEWDYQRNTAFPEDVLAGSSKQYWWKCTEGHRWKTSPSVRMRGHGCRRCVGGHTSAVEAILRTELQAVLEDIHPTPADVRVGDDRTVEADIVLPNLRLIIEYDGPRWHADAQQQDADKADALRKAGWTVIRVRPHPLQALHPEDLSGIDKPNNPDDHKGLKALATAVLHKMAALEVVEASVVAEYTQLVGLADAETARQQPLRWRSQFEPLEEELTAMQQARGLCAALRQQRRDRRHSMSDAARHIQVTPPQVALWERGHSVPQSPEIQERLAAYLQCTADELAGLMTLRTADVQLPTNPPSTLGEQLTSLRNAAGLSTGELANAVGVSISAVQRWERHGVEPRRSNFQQLAAVLDTTQDALAALPIRPRDEACHCELDLFDLQPGQLQHLISHRKAELGLTLEQLGERGGWRSTTSLGRWASGEGVPAAQSLEALALALDVPLASVVAAHPKFGRMPDDNRQLLLARVQLGLSLQDMADAVGVSTSTYGRMESKGRTVEPEVSAKAKQLLDAADA